MKNINYYKHNTKILHYECVILYNKKEKLLIVNEVINKLFNDDNNNTINYNDNNKFKKNNNIFKFILDILCCNNIK